MKNIMVSSAGGLIGYGILRSIRMSDTPYNLIGTSLYSDSVASGFCDVFIQSPKVSSEGYIDWLVKMIEDHRVDLLIPSFEDDVRALSTNIDRIRKTGVKVVLNKLELISLCADKWRFFQVLKEHDSPHLIPTSLSRDYDELVEEFSLPLLLKPRRGSASKGIVMVDEKEVFMPHKKQIGKHLLAQPFIGTDDQEFTTSVFGDGRGGFCAIMTLKRKLSEQGYTQNAEVFDDEAIKGSVAALCEIFKPIGPTNFQFRWHKGRYHLLEINPRISSSTSIRSSFGYNESVMAVDYYLNDTLPEQPKITEGKAVRYVEDFIFHA